MCIRDRIKGYKISQLAAKGGKRAGLNFNNLFILHDIGYIAAQLYFMIINLRRIIVFEHAVQCFFFICTDIVTGRLPLSLIHILPRQAAEKPLF